MDRLMESSANLALQLLQVNYPKLTREQCDDENLVTMQHAAIMTSIAKGERELGEIIGEPEKNLTEPDKMITI